MSPVVRNPVAARAVRSTGSVPRDAAEGKVRRRRGGGGVSRAMRDRELPVFTRGLAAMLDVGLPVDQALATLALQADSPEFRSVLHVVRQGVEKGQPLTMSMEKFPHVFSDVYINMLRPGEISGKMSEALESLASYIESSSDLRRRVQAAMMYPAIVSSVALILFIGILTWIVPAFEEIYDNLGAALPGPTRALIGISRLLRDHVLMVMVVFFACTLGIRWMKQSAGGAFLWERVTWSMPVFGPLRRKVALCRMTSTLHQTIRSGVPILQCLELAAASAASPLMSQAMQSVRKDVERGQTMAVAMGMHSVFPPMLVKLVGVGEHTGKVENMLDRARVFYQGEIDITLKHLTAMIEPFLIVFLGLLIGGVVVCMFIPVFRMHELLSV